MLLKSFKPCQFLVNRRLWVLWTVVKLTYGYCYCLYVKGASDILAQLCRWHVIVHQQGGPTDCGDVELAEIDDFSKENITRTIIFYANQTLCTIAHRNFASWLPPDIKASVVNKKAWCRRHCTIPDANWDYGHQRPSYGWHLEGSRGFSESWCCYTGDNVLTACSIAMQFSIFMAGASWRDPFSVYSMTLKCSRSLFSSSWSFVTEDKKILVKKLHTDGPALKTAQHV